MFELTNNPVSVSVHIDEVVEVLLDLGENHVAVAGHLVLLDVDHDPVISTHIPDEGSLKYIKTKERLTIILHFLTQCEN